MPTLNIGGQRVKVGDEFLSLSPEQQNATVEEIAGSLGSSVQRAAVPQGATHVTVTPSITDAVTDIPHEVAGAFNEGLANVKGLANRGEQGPISGLLTTGKAVLGAGQMALSPITGAARSLIGHPMAQAEHAVGALINPDVAAKDDPQKMYEAAKGDVDLAMSALGSRAPIAAAAAPVRVAPSISELKAAATAGFESPEVAAIAVKPQAISTFSQKAQTTLNNAGLDENLAPKTFAILGKLEKVPASSVVTGQNVQSIRRMLGHAAGSPDATEALAASHAIDALDDFLPNVAKSDVLSGDVGAASKTLETARGNYAAAKQAEKIDNKTLAAQIRASAVNAGQNVAGKIRQNMAAVADPTTPKNARGLLPEEVEAARKIAEGTRAQNALRNVGDALGGGGGIRAGVLGVGGAIVGGAPGAAIPLVGHVLRAISNKMTLNQAAKLSEMIRSRAPLASSVQKFNQAAVTVQQTRTPQAIGGIMLAARNLSTNMRSAGFNISPSDLLSGLQSPSGSDAKDQQQIPRPPGQ